MSKIALSGNSLGTGTLTISAPNTNVDRVLSLPDSAGTLDTIQRAGNVLQVVSATKVDVFSTTSTTYTDVTGLSVSITPTSASNKVLVFVTVTGGSATDDFLFQLVRNSTAIGNGTGGSTSNGFGMAAPAQGNNSAMQYSINVLDSPATTSATTYKVQFLVNSGTGFVNRRGFNASFGTSSSITVMEIAA
jgi:hypothetical protein